MKKLLTLLFALGAVTTLFAQTEKEKEEARRIILGQPRNQPTTTPPNDSRDIILGRDDRRVNGDRDTRNPDYRGRKSEIDVVNREYDAKVFSIRNNNTLSGEEKERMIRQLERDRARRIQQINNRYNERNRDRDNDRDDDRNRDDEGRYKQKKNKGNNGNHYGWEKGKGNPHRGGGKPGKGKKG